MTKSKFCPSSFEYASCMAGSAAGIFSVNRIRTDANICETKPTITLFDASARPQISPITSVNKNVHA